MKITIEPSDRNDGKYPTVSYDTGANDDLTAEIVEAALRLIVVSGHAKENVMESAKVFGEKGSIDYELD